MSEFEPGSLVSEATALQTELQPLSRNARYTSLPFKLCSQAPLGQDRTWMGHCWETPGAAFMGPNIDIA